MLTITYENQTKKSPQTCKQSISKKTTGYNAIVALDPENLFYMTGFWGEAIGVLDSSGAKIIAPALEASRAKADSSDCKVLSSDRGSSMITDLVSLLRGKKPCTDCTNSRVIPHHLCFQ